MKYRNIKTLNHFLKEYGMTPGGSTPVNQQQSAQSAKANKSVTKPSASPSTAKSPSPTTTPVKQPNQETPAQVMRKASELEVGTEFKDEKGKVSGIVTSPIGDGPKPDAVVVQDPTTKKYTVMKPDEVVNIDNPELEESRSTDTVDKLKKRAAKTKRKIKHLLRAQKHAQQGEPVFEINFNSKELAKGALNANIQCGFEAETVWPDLGEGSDSEDTDWLDDLPWHRVSDLIDDQEGSRAVERVEEAYREWLSEEVVYDFESEIVAELVNDRKEDEAYIDDFVSDKINMDEVEEYKEEKLERLEIDDMQDELEEYSDWDMDAWAREYVEIVYEDEFSEWLEEQIRDNSEAWDEAWERAMEQYDMDDWVRREHGGSWWSLLGDYDIYLYNEDAESGGVDAVASMMEDWASNNSKSNDVRPGGYHSGQGVDNDHWRVEDDSSIEGEGAKAEIISPVYDSPAEMLKEMKSLFEYMDDNNVDTNSSTGLHVTMSWMESDWAPTNKLKMAVLLGDKYVLKQFGREQNGYTKSQQETLQQYVKNLQQDIKDEKSLAGLEDILLGGISDGKFSSINFKDARNVEQNNLIEFRVAGGDDYHTMSNQVMKAVIRYAAVMQAGHDEEAYRKDYVKALFKMIAGKDTVSGDVVKRAQTMVDPASINDKVLASFQNVASEKHYSDAIEALSNAYMQLKDAQAKRNSDPQQELQFEDEEADWRRDMIVAQKYFVRAFAMLASDVASGANRAKPTAAVISSLRQALKDFSLTPKTLWDELQQSEFYKNFPGDVHSKSEKFASAVNSLLKKQEAKALEPKFTVKFDPATQRMFMPGTIADAAFRASGNNIFGDDSKATGNMPQTLEPEHFKAMDDSEYHRIREIRYHYDTKLQGIKSDMEVIDATRQRQKELPDQASEFQPIIDDRMERVKKDQAEAAEYKKELDQFIKKYGFVPKSVRQGSKPMGGDFDLVNIDVLAWLSQEYNIKFAANESVFAKFDALPLQEKLNLLSKIDTNKLNEAWSKKYKKSIDCNNPKGFSQKAHCAGKKKNETIEAEQDMAALLTAYGTPKKKKKKKTDEAVVVEKALGRADLKTPERRQAFAQQLRSNADFDLAGYKGKIKLDPGMADSFMTAQTPAELPPKLQTVDGQVIPYSSLEKTPEFGARGGDSVETTGTVGKVANKGEVAEGILGCGTFARLLVRPSNDVTAQDIENIIRKLPKDAPEKDGVHQLTLTAKEIDRPIADQFTLTLNLKPDTYADFLDESKWPQMQSISAGVTDYVNDNLKRYTDYFQANGKVDEVRVIADGVSGETDTKVDVFLVHKDDAGSERTLQHFDMSVKVGSVKQIGQVGGGRGTSSLDERFAILSDMWSKFGVDLSPANKKFVSSKSPEDAYMVAYTEAFKQIKKQLAGIKKSDETDYLMQLIETIKFFATLNDDRVKLVQFTDLKKGGYYVLDFKKLDRMLDRDRVDLDVRMAEDSKWPKITLFNTATGKDFLSIRMYRTAGGYIRNYIEKEKGLVELTKVRGTGMRQKVESVQEGAVPDNSTVKTLREILSKPLLSGDLKGQMIAYTAIPDPTMIKDFRAVRGMSGDDFDLRNIVRSYAKSKLHPDVLRKIK